MAEETMMYTRTARWNSLDQGL